MREATAAGDFIGNDTVRKYIARKIEPVQNLCQNLSESTHNVSVTAHSLLSLSRHANSTAVTLSSLVDEVVQEGPNLPEVSVQRLPSLRANMSEVRQGYANLRLDSDLTKLKDSLRLQKEKMAVYRSRIRQLKGEIDAMELLLSSLPSPCS